MSLNCPPRLEYFDRSGVINSSLPDLPPTFPYNCKRVGLDFQNQGTHPMWLVIMPLTLNDEADSKPTQYLVKPGESWYKDQFAPINEVRVIGTDGDPYAASEYGV